MSNVPAVTQLTKEIAKQENSFKSMLPAGMDPKRFMRTAVNAISTHAQSSKLLSADRQSLFTACQKAASDGLQIDGKEATLVTFSNQVQYMPMVQGLVKLARNSGKISKIVAEIVCENDEFRYNPGVDDAPVHDIDWFEKKGARGDAVGAYAVITLTDGEKIVTVMPKSRILGIGATGRNGQQYDPEKGPHYQEWWKKTVIKNALKYAPKSTYLESALEHDDSEYIDTDTGEVMQEKPAPAKSSHLEADIDEAQIVDTAQADDDII